MAYSSVTIFWRLLNRSSLRGRGYSATKFCCGREKSSGWKSSPPPPKIEDVKSKLIFAGILTTLGLAKSSDEKEEPKDTIEYAIKLGILEIQKGNNEKAELILHNALRMAHDLENRNAVRYIHDLLANLAYQQGNFVKAENLFKDVMMRMLGPPRNLPQDDNAIVEMSLKLATVYATWKHDPKAEHGYRFCIDTLQKKISNGITDEDTVSLLGMARDWYGQFLISRGRPKEALAQFQEALKTSVKLFGDSHSQSLVLLNSCGTAASHGGDHKLADEYFEKVVALGRESSSESLTTYLVNLGLSKMKRGLKEEALKFCSEGRDLAKSRKDSEGMKEAEECIKLVEGLK